LERRRSNSVSNPWARYWRAAGDAANEVKFVEVWKPESGAWRIHQDIWSGMGEA
jgi:hypothetical protein